mgnify:CR=1 FL=1
MDNIGFSSDETQRIFDSYNSIFVNKFPLAEMGLERPGNCKYILEEWDRNTEASACSYCTFHRDYFFRYRNEHHPEGYNTIVALDNVIEEPGSQIKSKLFISCSRKRITDLTPEECGDAEINVLQTVIPDINSKRHRVHLVCFIVGA